MKKGKFCELLVSMSRCQQCTQLVKNTGKDCSLINIYENNDFCQNIPSIWTDWLNRLDAKIVIIGQDWGPHTDMLKLYQLYRENPTKSNWNNLIEQEKSHTKKMLEYYIEKSSNGKHSLDEIFVTNAIMCARKGANYRGNNIDLKYSTNECRKFLLKQIEIVKPKVILTLGYYPLLSLANIYNFKIEKTLESTINSHKEIKLNSLVIIPLYHPVAQIKKETQLSQYKRIWKYIDDY